MFLDQRGLRALADWMIEAVRNPIIERLDRIMGTLVTVDSDVLAALATLAQTVDTEVGQLIAQGKIAPGDVSGIQTALDDANTQLSTAVAAGQATSTTDPSAPADGSTTPPADGSTDTGDGTTPPVDPNAPTS